MLADPLSSYTSGTTGHRRSRLQSEDGWPEKSHDADGRYFIVRETMANEQSRRRPRSETALVRDLMMMLAQLSRPRNLRRSEAQAEAHRAVDTTNNFG